MKKVWLVLSSLAVLVVLMGVSGCYPVQTGAAPSAPAVVSDEKLGGPFGVIWSQQQVGLWVTGEGKAKAIPDTALLTLGIEAEAATVAQAQQQAANAMDAVMKALKGKGVVDKDIQTQGFSIYPVRKWLEKEQREVTTGYRVSNNVIAKIRDLDKTGSTIDAVAQAGGDMTRISGISFLVDDPAPSYKEARDKAVADAMAKAKQIAGASGVKLGKLLYISEGVAYTPSVVRNVYMDAAKATPAETSISPGELEYQINIQMGYDID
jgi:hypothetical protein